MSKKKKKKTIQKERKQKQAGTQVLFWHEWHAISFKLSQTAIIFATCFVWVRLWSTLFSFSSM
jgi:hypothetical protein